MSTASATGVGPSVTTPPSPGGLPEGGTATSGQHAPGRRLSAPHDAGAPSTPSTTAPSAPAGGAPAPPAPAEGAPAPALSDDALDPIWRPDPATLDLPPPTFAHNSGTFAATDADVRIMSVNVNGGMLTPPAPGYPTPLQTVLHGAWITDTDFIFLQDTRVTWEQASWFEYLCWPWRVIQNPAPSPSTGGCAILTRGHWAARDFGRGLLPDGRGMLLEVKGKGNRYLALLNLYCWPGAPYESPLARLDPLSAFRKNQVIFDTCVSWLGPALARGRFLVMGGDLNMVLHAARDRAGGATEGHLKAQDMLRDFCARLRVAPPRLEAGATAATAWPPTHLVGTASATRLDYLMMPTHHAEASRGVATWSPRCIPSDHSVVMLTFNRHAALGDLDATDRQHAAAARRSITPFLTAEEAGPEWGELTAKLAEQYERITAALDTPRPGQDLKQLVSKAWIRFTELNERLGRRVNPSHFDTRPRKPAWNTDIQDASKLHTARRTILGAYEAAGRRASPAIAQLPQAARLPPQDLPPAAGPTRFQTQADVEASWHAWYVHLLTAYKEQTAEIRKLRTKLMRERARAKKDKATQDWQANPSVQSTAYKNTFREDRSSASASSGAYGPDPDNPLGPPIWITDPVQVKNIQMHYFRGLTSATKWNRAPEDPEAAPKTPPPPGMAAQLDATKTTDYAPYLQRTISEGRFRELLLKASFTSAPGPSGLSYSLIAMSCPAFQEVIRHMMNFALEHGVVPSGWQRGWIYPLLKDPDKGSALANLRPITLLETPLKLLSMHLNDSIHDAWDAQPTIHPVQNGFLRGVGTQQALLLVTTLYEKRYRSSLPTHVAYLDLEAAFCAVPHWAIQRALRRLNIPDWAVTLMGNIDAGAFTSVITAHGLSDTFVEESGVRQGCLLSPLKFIAWMDALLCWLHDDPSDIQLGDGKDLHALAYADDLWLVAATREALQAKLDKVSAFLDYHGVHCNAAKSNYSTTETGFRPGSPEQPAVFVSNLRTGGRAALTPVLPDEAVKYLGIRLTLYNDAAPQVSASQAKVSAWLRALQRSKLSPTILREMARAKIGGFLGYSLPHLDIADSHVAKWQQGLDAVIRNKERLTAFASTRQIAAPTSVDGLGCLDLFALRDSGTVAVIYQGLNSTSRAGDQPSHLAAALRSSLQDYRERQGFTTCPLLRPSALPYDPASRDPMKRGCTWTRMSRALSATGTFVHDRTYAPRPGRSRDIPLEAVPHILASLPAPAGSTPVNYVAEFAHLRRQLASLKLFYLGDVSNRGGDRLILPASYANLPDARLPAGLLWLKKHATLEQQNGGRWRPELGVGPLDPAHLQPDSEHWARLAFSHASPNHRNTLREHTTSLGVAPPRDLHCQWIRLRRGWWVISDGSGLHRSFAACVARGPSWRGVAGRVHGPANSYLAELWGLVHALQLIPVTDDAVILADCQGALFKAADGLPRHAAQRLKQACGEALNALQQLLDARAQAGAATTFRWYPGHVDKDVPVASLPPLGRAQVWCDEACRRVTAWTPVDEDALPGPQDESFSLWTPRQGEQPQARVPTNKLRSFLYGKAARTNAHATSRARPDLIPWQDPDRPLSDDAPKWLQLLLKGKAHQDLRRPYLLARQGLFVTPPLHDSLVGDPQLAFGSQAPCPRCHGQPDFPAHTFFDCPSFDHLRSAFDADVIRHLAPLIAPSWSTVEDTPTAWAHLQDRFPALSEVTLTLPDHSAPRLPPVGPQQYDPRTDPEVLANGQDLATTRARARPAPDSRLPKSLTDAAKKAIRALMPVGPARKPKSKGDTSERRPQMTLAACQAPAAAPEGTPPGHAAIWTVVEMWRQFEATMSAPTRVSGHAPLPLDSFPDELHKAWQREFGSRPLDDFRQCFATRGLLLDILQDLCDVNFECMAGPFNQHFRFPVRFSACKEDWVFGMHHDSLHDPNTGSRRRWHDFINLLPPGRRPRLLALYANPMYATQLQALLDWATALLWDAHDANTAVRLFALVPFDVARTISMGLARSGGRPLVVFEPHEYDFVFFSHWFGGSAGDAKAGTGAPFRLALLVWDSEAARRDFPLSPEAKAALRDWAVLSCRSEVPQVELSGALPSLAEPLTFEHSRQFFGPALLRAGRTPMSALPRHDAHREAATRLSGRHAASVVRLGQLAGLSTSAATACHKWLALRWLAFARDVWAAWGAAQPPRPPGPRTRPRTARTRHAAYTAAGLVARPTRAPGFASLPTQPAAPPRSLPLAFRPGRWLGPPRGIPSDAPDGALPLRTDLSELSAAPTAVRRKLGATKRGEQKPAVPSLASRPSAKTVCNREERQRRLTELFIWRQDLPRASPQTPCRECLQPGYLRQGTQWCFACRMGALHPHGPQDLPAWRFCRHCEICGDMDSSMALAGLAFVCRQCCQELRVPPPQPVARCTDCDSPDPAGSWHLGLDGRRLCNTHLTQECRPEGYRLARAQLIVAKAGCLTGNMPCYTAPYADRQRLEDVIACLPGGADGTDPLFAAVPWSVLHDPVLAAVNEHRQAAGLPRWESFPPCGGATAHPPPEGLPGPPLESRIAEFGRQASGRSHDARRSDPFLLRPSQRRTRKRKTFSQPQSPTPDRVRRPGARRDPPDDSDPDDRDDPDHRTSDHDQDHDPTPSDDPDEAHDDDGRDAAGSGGHSGRPPQSSPSAPSTSHQPHATPQPRGQRVDLHTIEDL